MDKTVRGMYCLRCSSKQVVRGSLGESARFYPLRGFFKAILGKPVFINDQYSHACLDCGLVWNELETGALKKNIRSFGLAPHSTGVMRVVRDDGSH
ncbi:hypothetical protein HZ993_08725 [Rhodoferax sp. AJA081-3]|uniref:hypothetical protein n=1 Tax=Rhodoferax sp. AJA081-3 TaxID=2752316 RepID=UPI001ADF666E|nr:hypothetical protein [Rhodoferax sp. AJA081-3]QTN29872.1 hypothetical protein HZ993_08725 [Rhodoferax sp. AJA081-3]